MKRPYKQLNLCERRKIEEWRGAKVSVDAIAERLERDRSTIFHELMRHQALRDTNSPRF
jgi:IS30 family transposase